MLTVAAGLAIGISLISGTLSMLYVFKRVYLES